MLLLRFLMRLHNKRVEMVLKNETIVKGYVESVDAAMNFHFTDVQMTMMNEESVFLDAVTIRGSSIRYIIFDPELNVDALMIDVPPKNPTAPKSRGRCRGRGNIAPPGRDLAMRGGRGQSFPPRGDGLHQCATRSEGSRGRGITEWQKNR